MQLRVLRVVFPPCSCGGNPQGGWGTPEKWGKITKFPFLLRPQEREKMPQKRENYPESTIFVIFWQFVPNFGGPSGEGNFVIFPHFSGVSAPEASRPLSKRKNNSRMIGHFAAALEFSCFCWVHVVKACTATHSVLRLGF